MDISQSFIVDLGWIFFATWGTVLASMAAIAFGGDLLSSLRAAGSERR
jgi:hypothetical protein